MGGSLESEEENDEEEAVLTNFSANADEFEKICESLDDVQIPEVIEEILFTNNIATHFSSNELGTNDISAVGTSNNVLQDFGRAEE